jgi:hypothetical protein
MALQQSASIVLFVRISRVLLSAVSYLALVGCDARSEPGPVERSVQSAELAAVQRSHVAANVPDGTSFDALLKRDLRAYFASISSASDSELDVSYDMLRDGPMQSGVAFPKYYVWVRVTSAGTRRFEGAVRVAAMDRTRFEVTDFLARATLDADPSAAVQVFPAAVCQRIETYLHR